jgi:hypothetical protein
MLGNKKSFGRLRRIATLWIYISHWIAKDEDYKLREVVWDIDLEITGIWKSVFNFIFVYSVDTFQKQFFSHLAD